MSAASRTLASLRPRCSSSSVRPAVARPFSTSSSRSLQLPGGKWLKNVLGSNMQNLEAQTQTVSDPDAERAKQVAAQKEGQTSLFEERAQELDKEKGREGVAGGLGGPDRTKTYTDHKYSTAEFKTSRRRLNDLGRQISGKPIDSAILQMVFSQKRPSNRIKSTLALARDHAVAKGLQRDRLVVSQAWVTKGKYLKRQDIKGRGRMGIKHHPSARLNVLLVEGPTFEQSQNKKRRKRLSKIRSAGAVREDVKIRNPGPGWTW